MTDTRRSRPIPGRGCEYALADPCVSRDESTCVNVAGRQAREGAVLFTVELEEGGGGEVLELKGTQRNTTGNQQKL